MYWLTWICLLTTYRNAASARAKVTQEETMHSKFFDSLRTKGWVLYVPELLYKAHQDGVLNGWSVTGDRNLRPVERMEAYLELLRGHCVDLKIPVVKPRPGHVEYDEYLMKVCDQIILYDRESRECPPFPSTTFHSDEEWDALKVTVSDKKSLMAWDGWVYDVRLFQAAAQGMSSTSRRILGLPPSYFGKAYRRQPMLVVLKKAYPAEQVRKLRRQIEEKIRKDQSLIIRLANSLKLIE